MGRAYIVLTRNDIEDNALQVLDLRPNTSLNAWSRLPQTGYLSFTPRNDTIVDAAGVTADDYYGLAAYILDNVYNVNDTQSLSAAQANFIADSILETAAAGGDLTLAAVNTLINTAGVRVSDLNGVVADSDSTGSLTELLRVLAGEVYKTPAGFALADNTFARTGAFVARTDANFRDVRYMVETDEMHLSLVNGSLSHLNDDTFVWANPSFTYASSVPTGTITVTGASIGNTVTIQGVVFTAAGAPDHNSQVWDQSGDDTADAADLAATINTVASQDLIKSALGGNGKTITATSALGVVTLTASSANASFDALTVTSNNSIKVRTAPTNTITLASVAVNDVVTIQGVSFTAKAAADFAAREFDQSGSDTADALSLVNCINYAANQALLTAALSGGYVEASSALGVVTLTGSPATVVTSAGTAGTTMLLSGTLGYPATTGTALGIGGENIPSTGAFRAVTVYDKDGNAL